MLAKRFGKVQITVIDRLVVDLEGIDPAIEIGVYTQDKTAIGINCAVSGQHHISPIKTADPVQCVLLSVCLNGQVERLGQATINQRSIDCP